MTTKKHIWRQWSLKIFFETGVLQNILPINIYIHKHIYKERNGLDKYISSKIGPQLTVQFLHSHHSRPKKNKKPHRTGFCLVHRLDYPASWGIIFMKCVFLLRKSEPVEQCKPIFPRILVEQNVSPHICSIVLFLEWLLDAFHTVTKNSSPMIGDQSLPWLDYFIKIQQITLNCFNLFLSTWPSQNISVHLKVQYKF